MLLHLRTHFVLPSAEKVTCLFGNIFGSELCFYFKVLTGVKALISHFLSAMGRTATPAHDRRWGYCEHWSFSEHGAEFKALAMVEYPAGLLCHHQVHIHPAGFLSTAFNSRFMISWKSKQMVFLGSRPSTSQRCQLMASPSRSSSVASHTSSDLSARRFSSFTTFFSAGTI